MSYVSIISGITAAIERMADHKALKYINYALMAALVLSSLMVVRGALGLALMKSSQGVESIEGAVTPQEPQKPFELYAPVVEDNIFDIKGQSFGIITAEQIQSDNKAPEEASAPVKPTVTLKLLGTVAWADASGYAFVIATGNEQAMYKRGEEIQGAGRLVGVYPDRITLDYRGNEYDVELDSIDASSPKVATASRAASRSQRPGQIANPPGRDFSKFARQTDENVFVVNKRALEESIQSPKNILTDARLIPNMVGGQQNGFKVLEIKRGGLYETLGLKNNDILMSVNESELSSMDSAMQAFTTLQGASTITLNVSRSGKNITLKYNIR